MIWFFTPYSYEKKLFNAYDKYMDLVSDPEDWVCFTDGDALFFQSNFGHIIADYIKKYPSAGLLTAYASRIGNRSQLLSDKAQTIDSIQFHYKVAMDQFKSRHLDISKINKPISGFLMVIKKSTWDTIKNIVKDITSNDQLLRVDNKISRAILNNNLDIIRMDGLYMLHYYRMVEGKKTRKLQ